MRGGALPAGQAALHLVSCSSPSATARAWVPEGSATVGVATAEEAPGRAPLGRERRRSSNQARPHGETRPPTSSPRARDRHTTPQEPPPLPVRPLRDQLAHRARVSRSRLVETIAAVARACPARCLGPRVGRQATHGVFPDANPLRARSRIPSSPTTPHEPRPVPSGSVASRMYRPATRVPLPDVAANRGYACP